jgi:hypothetical protein
MLISQNSTADLDHWLGFPLYNGLAFVLPGETTCQGIVTSTGQHEMRVSAIVWTDRKFQVEQP